MYEKFLIYGKCTIKILIDYLVLDIFKRNSFKYEEIDDHFSKSISEINFRLWLLIIPNATYLVFMIAYNAM